MVKKLHYISNEKRAWVKSSVPCWSLRFVRIRMAHYTQICCAPWMCPKCLWELFLTWKTQQRPYGCSSLWNNLKPLSSWLLAFINHTFLSESQRYVLFCNKKKRVFCVFQSEILLCYRSTLSFIQSRVWVWLLTQMFPRNFPMWLTTPGPTSADGMMFRL